MNILTSPAAIIWMFGSVCGVQLQGEGQYFLRWTWKTFFRLLITFVLCTAFFSLAIVFSSI